MLFSIQRREPSDGVRRCERTVSLVPEQSYGISVSNYGLPRYHGRRFVGISQSGLTFSQLGWYREYIYSSLRSYDFRAFLFKYQKTVRKGELT